MVLTLVQIFKVKSKAVVALIIVVVDVRSELKSLHTTPKTNKRSQNAENRPGN